MGSGGIVVSGYSKKLILLFIVSVFVVLAFFIGLRGRDPDQGQGVEYSDPNGPAILINSEGLYSNGMTSNQIELFRTGLGEFARITEVKSVKGDYIFTIENVNINKNQLVVEGLFDGNNDKISSEVILLNNDMATTSISNISKNITLFNELSINSLENQFVGSLDVERDEYFISYSVTDDLYIIDQKKYTENIVELVEKDFQDSIGRIPVRYEEYIILPPPKQISAPN